MLDGIAGSEWPGEIEGCKNFANVYADSMAGGITGWGSYVINSFNGGNVEATNNCCGGIVGESAGYKAVINCYNFGNIKGNTYVGGIFGGAWYTKTTPASIIENCYTIGNIEGNTDVGGILGLKNGYGTNTITNCYWPKEWGLEYGRNTGANGGILTVTNSVAKTKTEMKTAKFLQDLNDYVNAYNTANATNTDFVELENWVSDPETGYPVLE